MLNVLQSIVQPVFLQSANCNPSEKHGGKYSTEILGESGEGKLRKMRYRGEKKEETDLICNIIAF